MPEIKRIRGTRIIATPEALDTLTTTGPILRFAPDDALVLSRLEATAITDPHAIVLEEQGFVGIWLKRNEALEFLRHSCEWKLPDTYSVFAQGMVAGLAMKLYFEKNKVLFMVPAPFEKVLAEYLS